MGRAVRRRRILAGAPTMVGEKFERTGTKRLHREGGNLRLGLGFGKRKLCIALATWAEKKGVRRYGIIGLQRL